MTLKVVTGCTDYYYPGVKALANSITKHTNDGDIDLYCIYYGDAGSAVWEALDNDPRIKVIHNPAYPEGTKFPRGGQWASYNDIQMKAMYCRILLPLLFPDDDRVLWLDADTLVVGSLKELETWDFKGMTTAQPQLGFRNGTEIVRKYKGQSNLKKHCCAVCLYNVKLWNEKKSTQRYISLMNTYEGAPGGVVETLMNDFLGNDVCKLNPIYHENVKRRKPSNNARILHFPSFNPWDPDHYVTTPKPEQMKKHIASIWEPYR